MPLAPLGGTREQLNTAWLRNSFFTAHPGPSVVDRSAKHSKSAFIMRHGGVAVVAFLVGTGGLVTPNYISGRDQRGYRFGEIQYPAERESVADVRLSLRGSSENLARIRDVFVPSVTDLASWFNVSRQTIYNWQSGAAINDENDQRLERFARAADLIEAHGLAGRSSALRRTISGGKSYFALVRDGADPEATAQSLINIVQHELDQRRRLDERLANGPRKRIALDEVGSPHMDEDS